MGKVYTVERGATKLRAGQGLGAGLGVIIKHFADAFTKKLDRPDQTTGVFTVQYPEERLPLPESYRNFPILLYDDASGQELCTSCFQCQRVCPPQVIHMTQAKDPATGKAVPAVSEFIIEYDACMSCGLCAEVCPFDAIKMDQTFELSTDHHPGLTINREGLDRPISYYENLAPTFWHEARDNALKKLQGNVKRRPGKIGVAPQMVNNVAGNPISAAPPAVEQQPLTEVQPTASNEQATTDDKAARLAAIRARNAAKVQNAEVVEGAEKAETPVASAPSDDKAARLAAIRAANAAKKAVEQQTEVVATADASAVPTPVNDKAARLAAIRAANAAKKAEPQITEVTEPAEITEVLTAPANDKAARLAAIRAANAAKRAHESTGDEQRTTDNGQTHD